jgi:hypothetical protein
MPQGFAFLLDVSSSTAGAQRAVSPSTAGAQRTVSPTSRPARSLSAPAGTRGRGQGGFTLGKNITDWQDGPMSRFLKPISASASVGQVSPSDGAEAIEGDRKARDALFSTKFSATLRKERDETAGIKAMFVGLMTKEERGEGMRRIRRWRNRTMTTTARRGRRRRY